MILSGLAASRVAGAGELFGWVAVRVVGLDAGVAFLGPRRLTSIDGMEQDVPDSPASCSRWQPEVHFMDK
jgi:hypothetical protein